MDTNPYESPKEPSNAPAKASTGRYVLAIVLGFLTIPATAIAFFTTCLATFTITGLDTAPQAPLIVGTIGGLVVAAGMIYVTVRFARSPK